MFCREKADDDFDKPAPLLLPVENGPFYAVLLMRFNEGAEGGLVNDDDLRLVREDGTPFRGIYVVGDACQLIDTTSARMPMSMPGMPPQPRKDPNPVTTENGIRHSQLTAFWAANAL